MNAWGPSTSRPRCKYSAVFLLRIPRNIRIRLRSSPSNLNCLQRCICFESVRSCRVAWIPDAIRCTIIEISEEADPERSRCLSRAANILWWAHDCHRPGMWQWMVAESLGVVSTTYRQRLQTSSIAWISFGLVVSSIFGMQNEKISPKISLGSISNNENVRWGAGDVAWSARPAVDAIRADFLILEKQWKVNICGLQNEKFRTRFRRGAYQIDRLPNEILCESFWKRWMPSNAFIIWYSVHPFKLNHPQR